MISRYSGTLMLPSMCPASNSGGGLMSMTGTPSFCANSNSCRHARRSAQLPRLHAGAPQGAQADLQSSEHASSPNTAAKHLRMRATNVPCP